MNINGHVIIELSVYENLKKFAKEAEKIERIKSMLEGCDNKIISNHETISAVKKIVYEEV